MSRFVKGITLTVQEKQQIDLCHPASQQPIIRSHACEVTLLDGRTCQVVYRRFGACSHRFDYAAPLQERVWICGRIGEGVQGVEQKAGELAMGAFKQAQKEEQRRMKRKTSPLRATFLKAAGGPQMDAKRAAQWAGQYSVCARLASGRLLRMGAVYEQPEQAHQEIAAGRHSRVKLLNGQRLVIGICNRSLRCWQQAQFVAQPVAVPTAEAANPGKRTARRRTVKTAVGEQSQPA